LPFSISNGKNLGQASPSICHLGSLVGQLGSDLCQLRDTREPTSMAQFEEIISSLECSIHLDTLKSPVTLPCGHSFCQDCLQSVYERHRACPLCRRNLPDRTDLQVNKLLQNLIDQMQTIDISAVEIRPEEISRSNEVIGRGASAIVYRGSWLGREVALKTLLLDQGPQRQSLLTKLRKEIRVLKLLSHPSVAALYGTWTSSSADAGGLHLVLEYVDGGTLADALARSPPRARIIELALQICVGLEYIHARNVVHRDLKPANIMLTKSGAVKLVDFGVGAIMNAQLTQTSSVGSPAYTAPEIFRGQPISFAVDMYSFGVLLNQMLSGQPPYPNIHPFKVSTAVAVGFAL